MFAIAFEMVVSDLKKNYGEPYNNAYFAIGVILRKYGFYNAQGSVYLTERNDMANLYRAIEALKNTTWLEILSETYGHSRLRIGATLPQYSRNSDGTHTLTIHPLAAM